MTPTLPPLVDNTAIRHAPSGTGRSDEYIVWRDFKPRGRGVLDFIDDLFARLVALRLRIDWRPGIVTEYPPSGGKPHSYEFKFRAYRAVMARLACLCRELSSQDVSPYGGKGSFADPRWPQVRFHLDFMNTPAEQRLELTPVFFSEPA